MNQDWTSARIRIGVVDSGHAAAQAPHVAAAAAFVLDGGEPRRVPAEPDRLGHGSRVGATDRTRFVVCVQNHDQVGNRARNNSNKERGNKANA